MMQSTVAAPLLSPVNGKPILLNFDGAEMSCDAGLALLRQIDRRADLAGLVAKCLTNPRAPGKVRHSLEDIIRFRIMMIAAGYEDGNDADELRRQTHMVVGEPRRVFGRLISVSYGRVTRLAVEAPSHQGVTGRDDLSTCSSRLK